MLDSLADAGSGPALRQDVQAAAGGSTFAQRAVHRFLRDLSSGNLIIEDPTGRHEFGSSFPGESTGLTATMHVKDMQAYADIAMRGSIGAAESFMKGLWSTPDLVAVVKVFVANRDLLTKMDGALARFTMPVWKLAHWLRRNSTVGSKKNIVAHYDLGNEFFRLFLDETMMYSAAVFESPEASLADASRAKMDRICRKLGLEPGLKLVEIGTGWGGFAIHAARHYGCHVTTTTISDAQYEMACKRVSEAGLGHLVQVVREDYRTMGKHGKFDRLVSIEMIEAVGAAYLDTYIATCADLLKPEGMAVIQAITIADQEYERALRSVDFIQKYIFPGSFIPSVNAIVSAMTRASDFRLSELDDITGHYVTTLQHWRKNFMTNIAAIRKLGMSEEFIRMWEFYFAYCEGGFARRAIGDVQLTFKKPLCL